jgi:lysine N6-hydroxylase
MSCPSSFLSHSSSAYSDELFTPACSNYFFSLRSEEKAHLLAQQKLASDGISRGLLEQIYRCLYELEYLEERGHLCRLLPNREPVNSCRRSCDRRPVSHNPWRLLH